MVDRSQFATIEETSSRLDEASYLIDETLATSLFLAVKMGRPLFLEGAPGVGKTELAETLARVFQTELIRLQCYEGLDLAQAAYEWNYPRQLLALQARRDGEDPELFTEAYLLKRPLLSAIDAARDRAPVLLIDELDRADEEFESFLLELLSAFQITIPELGTLRAVHRPIVVLTSNRTREVHDALKRRCIYHWIDYPSFETEVAIVARKVPGLAADVAAQVVRFVQRVRREDLDKLPGVAETIDWSEALGHLDVTTLDASVVDATLGLLLKNRDDIERVRGAVAERLIAEGHLAEGAGT